MKYEASFKKAATRNSGQLAEVRPSELQRLPRTVLGGADDIIGVCHYLYFCSQSL